MSPLIRGRALAGLALLLVACGQPGAGPGPDAQGGDDGQPDGPPVDGAADQVTEAGPDSLDALTDGQPPLPPVRGILDTSQVGQGAIPFESLPWPSDLRLDAEGFLLPALPAANQQGAMATTLLADLRRARGAGVSTGIFFPFDGPIDPASLPGSGDAGLQPVSRVMLVDLDAQPIERIPIQVAARDEEQMHLVAVALRPGHTLRPRRRYGALVTRAVLGGAGTDGRPVQPAAGLTAALGAAALADPGAEALRQQLLPLREALDALGLEAGDLAAATVFTTDDPAGELVGLRDDLQGAEVPLASVLSFEGSGAPAIISGAAELDAYLGTAAEELPGFDNPSTVFGRVAIAHGQLAHLIHGSYPSPWYLSDAPATLGTFEPGPDGRPRVRLTDEVPFLLALPRCPGDSGCRYDALRVAVLQHGTPGDRGNILVVANTLAARGIATMGIDCPLHGSRGRGARDVTNGFTGSPMPDGIGDFGPSPLTLGYGLGPRALADLLRQCGVDLSQLVRLLKNPEGLAALRGLSADLAGLTVDGSRLVYSGVSFGAISGALAAGIEPGFGASVLVVGGGGLQLYLNPRSPMNQGANLLVAESLDQPGRLVDAGSPLPGLRPEHNPALNLYAQAFEPGDPLSYARRIAREPGEGKGPRHVLLMQARHDEFVADLGSEALGRSIGASFAVGTPSAYLPEYTDMPTLALAPEGIAANGPTGTTLVHQQYEPATHLLLALNHSARSYPAEGTFPPFDTAAQVYPVDNPVQAAQRQYADFIDTYFRTGVPVVLDPGRAVP